MLEFLRNLRCLSIAVDYNSTEPVSNEILNDLGYFRVIRNSGQNLSCLRFDISYRLLDQIPAPGIHELISVRYLEVGSDYIRRMDFEPGRVLLEVQCFLE